MNLPSFAIVGHRGGRGEGYPRENTIAAFERARAEGASGIELDVRMSADDELVVFHDATLAETTHGEDRSAVASLSARELARRYDVPLLSDALAWAEGAGLVVNVELKYDVPQSRFVSRIVRTLSRSAADVIVSSFDPRLLMGLWILGARRPCALLTHADQRYAPLVHRFVRGAIVTAIHPHVSFVTERRVRRWKRAGLRVGAWTVNDVETALAMRNWGVDYVISDCPGTLVSGLRACR